MSPPKPAAEPSHKVLVIEDERQMAMVLDRALVGAGFQVTTAETGEGGLEVLAGGEFSLTILDLLLPDATGVSVLARARTMAPDTPVLVFSAVSDVHSKVVCLELGACDYVEKPCELAELVARVRLRMQLPAHPAPSYLLKRGHYVLDLQQRMLQNGSGRLPLTTREFVLLKYLMERAGEICTREELLEHVWGYTFDPGTNVVNVCVGRLRHKVNPDCVMTVRNVGYSFVGR